MIARLSGILEEVAGDCAVIDVHGVGYCAFCSTRTLGRLPQKGAPVRLLIETHVREDHIHLYGFIDAAEREWFRLLLRVQGVGARLALAILSSLAPERLRLAMLSADKRALAEAEGVGPRLAARIVNELKDKLGGLDEAAAAEGFSAAELAAEAGEAVSALVNLGYSRSEALAAVGAAARRLGASPPPAALIRASLKEMVR
jgi:holliday junction DNA helicase RuvA